MKYKANRLTLVKVAPVQSRYLSEAGFRRLKAGEIVEVAETLGSHARLSQSFWSDCDSYIFLPHFDSINDVNYDYVLEQASRFIAMFEGLRLEAYLDAVNIPTIGYGSTYIFGRPVKLGDKITRQQAIEALTDYIRRDYEALAATEPYFTSLTANQQIALLSFVYNVGKGAFRGSTLRKRLKEGHLSSAARELLRWDKAGGKTLAGLTRRRQEEYNLFNR